MSDMKQKILQALVMGGLTGAQVKAVEAGAAIYGDDGIVDSLGLVRLVAAVSDTFGDLGVDMFDMLIEADLEAATAFSHLASIEAFLGTCFAAVGAGTPGVMAAE